MWIVVGLIIFAFIPMAWYASAYTILIFMISACVLLFVFSMQLDLIRQSNRIKFHQNTSQRTDPLTFRLYKNQEFLDT